MRPAGLPFVMLNNVLTILRIFAIGDVAGEPMLAHKASHQAKIG